MQSDSTPPQEETPKLTLQAILEHRGMFKLLFDSLPMQVIIKSARPNDFGSFLLWNRTAADWIGLTENEVIGRTDYDFFPRAQADHFHKCDLQVFETGQPLDIPAERLTIKDGREITLHTVKTPIFSERGEPIALLLVSEDITEKLAVADETRRLTEFLQRVAEEMPGAVFEFHADGDGNYRFAYISIGAEKLFELPTDALIRDASLLFRHIAPMDLPEVMSGLERSRLDLSEWTQEFHISPPSGKSKLLHVSCKPRAAENGAVVWFGFLSDVTEIRQHEVEWHRMLQLLRHVTAQIPGAVYQLQVLPGKKVKFTYLSEGFTRLCGVSAAAVEADASLFFDLIVSEDREQVLESLFQADEEHDQWRREFRVRRPDGKVLWMVANARPDRDTDGTILLHGHLANISHTKHMQYELMEARDAAQRASTAKSDFLAMLSHEIRTPLNAILGFADVLGWSDLDNSQRDCVNTIRESGGALLTILNDVLDFSKIEAGKLDLRPEPVDVERIVKSTANLFREQTERKGIELQIVTDDRPIQAIIDPTRLQQIVANLVSNAVKFTRKGRVTVRVEAAPIDDRDDWQTIFLEVIDTGIGIPKAKLSGLFTPFQQIDTSFSREAGGTGLGLSIVKKLANLMGGDVSVESGDGLGSEFRVWISCKTSNAAFDESTEAPSPQAPPDQHFLSEELPLRILIIEDNAVNRRLLRLLLERLGYHPDEAANGDAGIQMARTNHYDLVLLDLRMPGMDGFEAAKRLKSLGDDHAKRIVAVTAHTSPAVRENCLQAGMTGFLPKPVQPKTLASVLRDATSS